MTLLLKPMSIALYLFALFACANRPVIPVAHMHQICPAYGCHERQECMRGTDGTSTCEIACQTDQDCPALTKCELPPAAPGNLPYTCR